MTKDEFLKRVENDNLNTGEYILILDKISDAPHVIGCAFDQGFWKVYKTNERGGHYVIIETKSETDAFNYLYELVLIEHNDNGN